MQITITATLTPEQVQILSAVKGYNPVVTTLIPDENGNMVSTETPNPQSPEDFIRQVYEGMIINDAKSIFTTALRQSQQKERIAEEQAIQDAVVASISSNIQV